MSDTYTIPEMELTPEGEGRIRLTMKGGEFTFMPRTLARRILCDLGLGVPE